MTTEVDRCYLTLELERGASLEQVKQARRELAKVWHPDRFLNDAKLQRKAEERLKEVNGAYEVLEQYLTSGSGSLPDRGPTSRTSDPIPQQPRKRSESETTPTGTPPPGPAPSPASTHGTSSDPKRSRSPIVWLVIGGILVLLLIAGFLGKPPSGSSSGSDPSGIPSSGGPEASLPAPTAKLLDAKNGFKDFKFGMTPEEAHDVFLPTAMTENPGVNVTVLQYRGTPLNRIGDFSTDMLSLTFFDGRLYRVDVSFSSFQNEIFEACRVNYGQPSEDENWARGDQKLHAKSWRGERVSAAILAPPYTGWNQLVIYDIRANQEAQEYAAKEPERASKDFGESGFKTLVFGMRLSDVPGEFEVVQEDRLAAVKKIAFKTADWQKIGFYPLKSISAEFFHEKLYRLDLAFDDNQKEIFRVFQHRFTVLQDDETWTRAAMKLKGKSARSGKLSATILGPITSDRSQDHWDAIALLDSDLWHESEQFKMDAPKRAAKDF